MSSPIPASILALSSSCPGLHPSHLLDDKIRAAAKHGFAGIEIVYGDLECYSHANSLNITSAAHRIRELCDTFELHILSLCPFENFEGHPSPLKDPMDVAKEWIELARILRTDISVIVRELQQLVDLGAAAKPPVGIAYEPMGWSIVYKSWESALGLTKLVSRPNFGICIDSFHVASLLWGDPSHASGKYPDADRNLASSLARLVRELPLEKLFYVQLSGGERFSTVYSSQHPWYLEGEAKEFTCSKHARPFPRNSETICRMREPDFHIDTAATRARTSVGRLRKAACAKAANL
ncbi:AP endonuclease, family 2 [Karstenula rhodostoma CBS 690.94]|uniref:AP endonuclease, family 2 n=1 Tax=Karstenula rhodostoma CBS 690.94 TaxID=1392251 RepID=A0A9P4U8B6_9PLEO|nr:AP endonuclease, family 2 [Karstenula rhodostoma CBS 690.94]